MAKRTRKKNSLTKAEMNSGAFKVLQEENVSLKRTLINTQNELEEYRSKYHESDKKNGINESLKTTIVFHEVLKFLATGGLGGISINLFTEGKYLYAGCSLLGSVIIYIWIVSVDNNVFKVNEKK